MLCHIPIVTVTHGDTAESLRGTHSDTHSWAGAMVLSYTHNKQSQKPTRQWLRWSRRRKSTTRPLGHTWGQYCRPPSPHPVAFVHNSCLHTESHTATKRATSTHPAPATLRTSHTPSTGYSQNAVQAMPVSTHTITQTHNHTAVTCSHHSIAHTQCTEPHPSHRVTHTHIHRLLHTHHIHSYTLVTWSQSQAHRLHDYTHDHTHDHADTYGSWNLWG